MSWQAYVDDHLVGTGKISKAAIIGKQGGIWAASKGYNEQDAITKTAFAKPDEIRGHGLTLGGFKFMVIKAEADEVIGRKGERGCFLIPTQQAILVTEYEAPTQAGDANVIVSKLADYLKSVNY